MYTYLYTLQTYDRVYEPHLVPFCNDSFNKHIKDSGHHMLIVLQGTKQSSYRICKYIYSFSPYLMCLSSYNQEGIPHYFPFQTKMTL